MPNPTPGTVLGPYTVEGFLGAGSMGDVFRAVDTSLGRKVAIKLLAEKHRDSPELRARFTREGRAVAKVQHPNVVQVFTTGVFDERPYIAMEFLEGADLGTVVDDGGPMTSLDAARAARDAAAGLAAAAAAGLIHRDVKPSNLVRLSSGVVKVTDFGLAKPVDPGSEPALTALGVVVGTPDYIAPEQARGEAIDDRVDIYALGGSLYFLLTGKPPFRTGVAAEDKYLKVVARHLRQPPPDAREKSPKADAELAELARALMAKKPAERPRYPELIEHLEAIVARLAGGRSSGSQRAAKSDRSGKVDKSARVSGPIASRAEPPRPDPTPVAPVRTPAPAPRGSDDDLDEVGLSTDLAAVPPLFTRGLALLTVVAVLVLIVGTVAYVATQPGARAAAAGDAGSGSGSGTGGSAAAAVPPDARPGPPPAPTAPAGMALVRRADGTPWFFVDARPVTHKDYAALFATHKVPAGGAAKPVVGTSYTAARAFAKTTGGRLVLDDEWEAALATAGVEAAPAGTFEWVDAGEANAAAKAKAVRARGKRETREAAAPKDVTFRRARDL